MSALARYGIGLLLALHGLVHLWYVVLSQGWVEVEEAMGWNGTSLLLSGVLPEGVVLDGASVLYVVVAAGFVVGGVGYAVRARWATPVLVGSAVLSTVVVLLMWDGQLDRLADKGLLGVLINAFVLVWLLVLE